LKTIHKRLKTGLNFGLQDTFSTYWGILNGVIFKK